MARSTDGQTTGIGPCTVKVTRNSSPSVKIVPPGRDIALEALVPVEIGITDDNYGISRVELQYRPSAQRTGALSRWRAPREEGERRVQVGPRTDEHPARGGHRVPRRGMGQRHRHRAEVRGVEHLPAFTREDLYNLRPQQAIEQAQKAEEEAVSNLEAEAKDIDKTLDNLMHRAEGGQIAPRPRRRRRS